MSQQCWVLTLVLSIFLFSGEAYSGGEFSGGSAKVFKAALRSRNLHTSYERYQIPGTGKKVKPFTQLCFDKTEYGVRADVEGLEDDFFPLNYEQYQCVEWLAGDSHSHQSRKKFTDKRKARFYAKQKERPYFTCSKKDWVPKKIPLYYHVDFYGKKVYRLEGRFQYRIPDCDNPTEESVVETIKPVKELNTELL